MSEALAEGIQGMWQQGRTRWPELPLELADFARHVLSRSGPAGPSASGGLNAEDLYLACCCARGEPAALEAFDRTVLDGVAAFVAHIDPSPSFADEVRQLLRTRLLLPAEGAPPRIGEYAGAGTLRGWVRVIAVRTAL